MAEEKQGWTALLVLICVSITLGTVIPVGYTFSVVNGPMAVGHLKKDLLVFNFYN